MSSRTAISSSSVLTCKPMNLSVIHNSRIIDYRRPLGALRCGEKAVLSIRLSGRDAYCCNVYLRLWKDGAEQILNGFRHTGADGIWYGFEISAPERPQLLWYYFIIDCGGKRFYYGSRSGEGRLSSTLPEDYQITCYDGSFTVPEWFCESIVYQIFPDRFNRGTPEPGEKTSLDRADFHRSMGRRIRIHEDWNDEPCYLPEEGCKFYSPNDYFGGDLKGITEKLPYLASLGIKVIYLNPIFEAASNHRYNTSDYLSIDPILGSEYDFAKLTEKAAEYGISVMLDGVFSHTGDDSVYFNKYGHYSSLGAYSGKGSPYYDWYDFRRFPDDYRCWWNFDTLPEVNEMTPSYVEFIYSVLQKWTTLGARAWRLDVADELPDDFIKLLRARLKSIDPEAVLLGEVWEDASNKTWERGLREYVYGHELDSVMNYPFADALCDFLTGRSDAFTLNDALASQQERYPEPFYRACMNVLGSHDTQRLLSELSGAPDKHALSREEQAEFILTDEQLSLGKKRQKLAAAIQYSMPQPPCLYYADEAGMTGLSDPFNRKTYPWGCEDAEMIELYRLLGHIRNTNPVLLRGEACFLPINADVFAVYRKHEDSSAITIVNRSNATVRFELRPCDFIEGNLAPQVEFSACYTDLLNENTEHKAEGGSLLIEINALTACMLLSKQ